VEFYLNNLKFDKIFSEALINLNDKDSYKKLSNYVSTDLAGIEKSIEVGKLENISGIEIAEMVNMILKGELSSRGAKDLLLEMYKNSGSAKKIAEDNNLIQKSDEGELKNIAMEIIKNNPEQVEGYKNGEEKLLQYFVGQGMKATQGSANPGIIAKLFKELL